VSKLWIPEEGLSDKAIEVFTNLEYAQYKLKVFKKQQESITFELSKVKSAITQMDEMVDNLRGKTSRIVSIREFYKIQSSIDNARKLEKKWSDSMVKYQQEIAEISSEIENLQKLFDQIKNNNGKVLEFKKHAKRKRSKDRQ
jgi:predicted  nucleic acid-binding Zn-ribbon protein